MKISAICIERPVFATVLSLVVMLLGLVSYERLSVREYPKIDEPVVTVTTDYRGASADIIESQVTKPLEDSLAGIEGVEVLTSISRAERSQMRPVNLAFGPNREGECYLSMLPGGASSSPHRCAWRGARRSISRRRKPAGSPHG